MKVIKQTGYDRIFPYIAYIPEKLSAKPALIIQLHGAGERGNGADELDKVEVNCHFCDKVYNFSPQEIRTAGNG